MHPMMSSPSLSSSFFLLIYRYLDWLTAVHFLPKYILPNPYIRQVTLVEFEHRLQIPRKYWESLQWCWCSATSPHADHIAWHRCRLPKHCASLWVHITDPRCTCDRIRWCEPNFKQQILLTETKTNNSRTSAQKALPQTSANICRLGNICQQQRR